jgi:hypothetical protein
MRIITQVNVHVIYLGIAFSNQEDASQHSSGVSNEHFPTAFALSCTRYEVAMTRLQRSKCWACEVGILLFVGCTRGQCRFDYQQGQALTIATTSS